MDMKKTNNLVAFAVFVVTSIVYLATVAPTVSFWDCGEFIACSYKMAVPHPPGAPLYLLVGRMFSMLPFMQDVAFKVNLISVFSSSITVMLLYLTIVHLVREWKGRLESASDWMIAISSAVIGSLSFAFTHSFWFNAVEAEVYAGSMLFTSLIVWLVLVWAEKSEEPGNERYLLMISYLIGLAIAVHLLNVLALPFVAMIYYYKRYNFNVKSFAILVVITGIIMVAVYPGMVKWIPQLALHWGAFGLGGFLLIVFAGTFWALNNKKHLASFAFLSILLITIGYSSYAMIYIRSNLNPNIDENNPENIENFVKYINREQYGAHDPLDRKGTWETSPNSKLYTSTSDFFWNYQINKMYVRYFLWQFVGMDEDEVNWSASQFWALPFLLGLVGMFWHFRRDPKHAFAVFALFFMTGLAIIFYLNQPDPQPRERDYSYVGSFFAFAIWIGLGYAGILDMIREIIYKNKKNVSRLVMGAVLTLLVIIVPFNMFAKNYHSHDRSGNYVAFDYSYNMLMSCEPNGILFTNGDNDTFPLWYLQEVEKIRTDVRIVNLSLLNTDWYIRQLRDLEPTVPMKISEAELDRLGLMRWKSQKYSIKVPPAIARQTLEEFKSQFDYAPDEPPEQITFTIEPTMNTRFGSVLRTQDYMILNIIAANRWQRPIYFAVTVPRSNLLGELSDFMRMDGLVLRLVPFKNWEISPDHLARNLKDVYQYRGLDDPTVYYNDNIKGLLQNYRTAYVQLAEYYVRNDAGGTALTELMTVMEERIPADVIPWTSKVLRLFKDAVYVAADTSYADSLIASGNNARDLSMIGNHLLRLTKYDAAVKLLEKAYEENAINPQNLSLLIRAYQMGGTPEKAIKPLEDWLKINPTDKVAQDFLNSIKKSADNN